MDNNKIIEQYLEVKNNDVTPKNQSHLTLEGITSNYIMFWGIFGFVICWAAIFFMLSKRVRFNRKEVVVDIKTIHQIPCRNCKFYSNDPHLKCAVNPSTVLTEQAINCSDYCAKEPK